MEKTNATSLKQQVWERLERSRLLFQQGSVDMAGVQESVRDYCQALAQLPREELAAHKESLEDMVRQLDEMSEAMRTERDVIRAQLDGLGRLRQANVAYQTSDSIGKKPTKEGK